LVGRRHDDGARRLLLTVLGGLAEFERVLIKARTVARELDPVTGMQERFHLVERIDWR
jgi:hypothetical protein